jgi:cytochrome P450 / NADPH-cytochrome P450 reductase
LYCQPCISSNNCFRRIDISCSTYLERLSPGDRVQISLRPSRASFHPPSDDKAAMITVCAGTGLAPFRAFVSERALKKAAGAAVGPAFLFYGLNAPDEDDMYKEEFDKWEKQGVVSVRRAFTFAAEKSKGCKFVQDRIWEDRKEVAKMFRQGAQIYMCGAGVVGVGVEQAMVKIRCEERGCSEEEAKACDRCHSKKCRCDGNSYCWRCKADNTICSYA